VDQKKRDNLTLEERLAEPFEDESRSIKSEFDYTTKKKFVEMISQQRKGLKLMPGALPDGVNSKDDDRVSAYSRRTGMSVRSGRLGLRVMESGTKGGNVEPIPEQANEVEDVNVADIIEEKEEARP
jgi:hypothetical protein